MSKETTNTRTYNTRTKERIHSGSSTEETGIHWNEDRPGQVDESKMIYQDTHCRLCGELLEQSELLEQVCDCCRLYNCGAQK
jgi:hypothetical protein